VDEQFHVFLIPVLVVEWSASVLGRFTAGEIIPSPNLIYNYAMKAYWGVDVYIHDFLTPVFVSE
jgi:hypothetical protein